MRGMKDVNLRQVDGMTLQEMIEFVVGLGYDTGSMSNDEIYQITIEALDGHSGESDEEELDFGD